MERLTEAQLRKKLRESVEMEGSVNKWAKKHSIPRRSVDMALSGERSVSEDTAKVLGYEKCDGYTKITKQK